MRWVFCVVIITASSSWYVQAANFFSNSYQAAREQFRKNSENLKNPDMELGSLYIPSAIDSDLTMDYVYIPPAQRMQTLLIMTSGVHGPEGFAGSAVQNLILQQKIKNTSYQNTGILMIHAVNPYGFKYKRRVTEHNIDLNRNFDMSRDIFKTPNPIYKRVAPILERAQIVSNYTEVVAETLFKFLGKILGGLSVGELVQAVGQGQYESPKGLYYGGTDFEPQVQLFSDLIDHYGTFYQHIAFIDFHTGIGKKGELTLMSGRLTDESSWAQMLKYFPEQKKSYYTLYNGNVGSFFYIFGDIIDLVNMKFGNKVLFSMTAEYGTLGNSFANKISSVSRMIAERAGFYNGYKNTKIKSTIEQKFLELFNPNSTSWQNTILQKGSLLYDQTLLQLENNSQRLN